MKLYTYLNVKEDALQLYGFLTRDDLEVFRLLIGVSGIGPKGALGILSGLTPDELRFAVMSNDVKAISAAPGIGKKTAEKLILELKDKLRIEDVLEHAASEGRSAGATAPGGAVATEAVQALVALGYGSTEALQAVKQVEISEDMEVEEVLKAALEIRGILRRNGEIDYEQKDHYNRKSGRRYQDRESSAASASGGLYRAGEGKGDAEGLYRGGQSPEEKRWTMCCSTGRRGLERPRWQGSSQMRWR